MVKLPAHLPCNMQPLKKHMQTAHPPPFISGVVQGIDWDPIANVCSALLLVGFYHCPCPSLQPPSFHLEEHSDITASPWAPAACPHTTASFCTILIQIHNDGWITRITVYWEIILIFNLVKALVNTQVRKSSNIVGILLTMEIESCWHYQRVVLQAAHVSGVFN